ncbi:MAG: hypothetical protein JRI34_04410 [Deltaproteobacteria bacterium]|nr:hypothetical protein [Deltaproteobacteria bacterium]
MTIHKDGAALITAKNSETINQGIGKARSFGKNDNARAKFGIKKISRLLTRQDVKTLR